MWKIWHPHPPLYQHQCPSSLSIIKLCFHVSDFPQFLLQYNRFSSLILSSLYTHTLSLSTITNADRRPPVNLWLWSIKILCGCRFWFSLKILTDIYNSSNFVVSHTQKGSSLSWPFILSFFRFIKSFLLLGRWTNFWLSLQSNFHINLNFFELGFFMLHFSSLL